MPTDRYRLYHVEKAKGGIGMTMTAGSAVVAEDSPPAFGNLHAYKDEIVPWHPAHDRRGPRARRGVHDPDHPPRPAHRLGAGRLAAGRRPVAVARAGPPRHPEGGRGLGHRAHRRQVRRRRRADAGRRDGRHRDRGLRPPVRPVLVAAHQPSRPTSTAARSRTGCASAGRCCAPSASGSGPTSSSASAWPSTSASPGGIDTATGARDPPSPGGGPADRLRQRHPRPHRQRGGAHRGHPDPRHARRRRTSTSPARCARQTGLAVLHASKVDDVATARHAIREGKVDLVGMTRAHLADPHIVRKIIEGREAEIRPVRRRDLLPRPHLRSGRGAVHPQRGHRPRGRRCRTTSRRPSEPRRIVVVGAGPGGLEAARVGGERGHDVIAAGGDAVGRRADPPRRAQPAPHAT